MAFDFETDLVDDQEPSTVGEDLGPDVWTTSVRETTEESDPTADDPHLHGDGGNTSMMKEGAKPELNAPTIAEEPCNTNRVKVEVVLSAPPELDRRAFAKVVCEDVDRVISKVPSLPGEIWYEVAFEDGRIDQVAFEDLLDLPNGYRAIRRFDRKQNYADEDLAMSFYSNNPRKRRRKADSDYESNGGSEVDDDRADNLDDGDDEDEDEVVRRPTHGHGLKSKMDAYVSGRQPLRNTRRSSRLASVLGSESWTRGGHQLRSRQAPKDDDLDELAHDPRPLQHATQDDSDGAFTMVKSDLQQPTKIKRRKRSSRALPSASNTQLRGSSIEFELVRRSGRANKNTRSMKESMNDEEFYAAEDEKLPAPAVPKVISVKEVFKPVDGDDFKDVHAPICDSCGGNGATNKGALIYCQGCSLSFHKVCLGYRSTREHLVTKIGVENFVLQCRYCITVYIKKDPQAPNHATCQTCRGRGESCSAFSERKTAKQEEKIRLQNGGEDPVTEVSPSLINNPSKVLFRCLTCRRPYHFEHLPALGPTEGPMDLDDTAAARTARLAEYLIDWRCKECLAMREKVQTLVAWRPRGTYSQGATGLDIAEDEKEYLVKWDKTSYAYCTWMSGAWVWGVTNAPMRISFWKRNDGENLLPKFHKREAIPEEYLVADIILAVKYKHRSHASSSKEADLERIAQVDQARVKFIGLGYDEAVWDAPPPRDSELWAPFEVAYGEYLNGKYFKVESQHTMKERIKAFRSLQFKEDVCLKKQPDSLRRGKLLEYQLDGLNWLLYNFHQEHNAVLADEMGLGKTVQVISLIAHLVERPRIWPFLVVVPNSTCPNWRREIKYWTPDLRVVTYHGGKLPQELAYKCELFPDDSKQQMRAHVVVMSYDSAQDENTRTLFKSVQWAGLVVDEGQRLKNDRNLLYGALRAMKIPFRLLLTGTPLQNNKRELFNLLQFIDSSHDAVQLDEQYQEITAENLPKLHNLIRPYFLRRTKALVLGFLPPMAQIIIPVTMTVVQEKLCKSIIAKNPDLIRAVLANSTMKTTERGSLNNILMQLRKCLCHPFIYSAAVEDKNAEPETMCRNLIEASAKLLLLNIMLPKLKEQGHRVLIFSQFLDQLDIIEDFLTSLGPEYRYQRLDGRISSLEKQKRIDQFNAPDSPLFAFLLSTRAGGVGINLATADTVIILDPDFNPHQDIQALSRAHRIGQRKKVLCFQLMTKASVEEKMMQIGRKKMALDHALIETMDFTKDADNEDLESILKHGAEALFSDSQKDIITYDSAAVDKLLDRSQLEAAKPVEAAKSSAVAKPDDEAKIRAAQFSFARVWANDQGALADDLDVDEEATVNPSVWESILKQREEDARREAEQNKEVLGRGGRRRHAIKYSGPTYRDEDGAGGGAVGVGGNGDSEVDDDFVINEGADESEDSSEQSGGEEDDGGNAGSTRSRKSQGKSPQGPEIRADIPVSNPGEASQVSAKKQRTLPAHTSGEQNGRQIRSKEPTPGDTKVREPEQPKSRQSSDGASAGAPSEPAQREKRKLTTLQQQQLNIAKGPAAANGDAFSRHASIGRQLAAAGQALISQQPHYHYYLGGPMRWSGLGLGVGGGPMNSAMNGTMNGTMNGVVNGGLPTRPAPVFANGVWTASMQQLPGHLASAWPPHIAINPLPQRVSNTPVPVPTITTPQIQQRTDIRCLRCHTDHPNEQPCEGNRCIQCGTFHSSSSHCPNHSAKPEANIPNLRREIELRLALDALRPSSDSNRDPGGLELKRAALQQKLRETIATRHGDGRRNG